jgi:hypothetical protein
MLQLGTIELHIHNLDVLTVVAEFVYKHNVDC